MLIDVGYSPNAREEVTHRPPVARFFNTVAIDGARDWSTLTAALQKVGASPEGLKWFIPSHAHLDHLGGRVELRDVPVLLPQEELSLIQRWQTRKEVLPEHTLLQFFTDTDVRAAKEQESHLS